MVTPHYDALFAANLDSLLKNWGPVSWRSLVAQAPPPPDPSLARLFTALARIEDDASYMQVKIRLLGAFRFDAVREFNTIWLAEESEHARALAALAVRFGGGQALSGYDSHKVWHRDRQALFMKPFLLFRGFFPAGLLAGYFALGAIQELVALTTYNAIAELVDDPCTREILGQVSRQEGRHMRFYRLGAEAILTRQPAARRYVRYLLRRYWRPPGVDLLGYDNWFECFAPLLSQSKIRDRMVRVDELCARMPGIGDLGLMRSFLARHEAQRSAATPTPRTVAIPT